MTITVNGVDWDEPSLELRPLSMTLPSQITPLDIIRQFHDPSTRETSHILALIAIEEQDASIVRKQIQPLQSRLNALISDKRRSTLQPFGSNELLELERIQRELNTLFSYDQRIMELRHIVSVVRRVPFDLWERIFSLASACDRDNCPTFSVVKARAPEDDEGDPQPRCTCAWKFPGASLSQVCTRWRMHVGGIPRLWSRFSINLDEFPARLQPLLEFYKRTVQDQGHPLEMRLVATRSVSTWGQILPVPNVPPAKRAIETLLAIFSQCRLLNLNLAHDFIRSALNSPPTSGWKAVSPALTTFALRLGYPGSQNFDRNRWLWDAIRTGAPNLRNVTISELHNFQPELTVLPYHQLTSLDVDRLSELPSRNLRKLLPLCTSLEKLEIGYYDPPEGPGTGLPAVEVPTLRELNVTVMQFPDQLVPLFREHTFPHLRTLKISLRSSQASFRHSSWVSKRDNWDSGFLDHLRASVRSLERLSFDLDNPQIPDGSLPVLPIIRVCTAVKWLDLRLGLGPEPMHHRNAVVIDLLQKFKLRTDLDPGEPEALERRSLVPRLEKLSIRDEWLQQPTNGDVQLMLDVLESRMRGGVGLGRLEAFEMIYGPSPPAKKKSQSPYELHYVAREDTVGRADQRIRNIRERGAACVIERADPNGMVYGLIWP
ncbi:hypothetical protein AAF712_011783 [Marasmius tenuissimus]|uniref:F-box domain-containing protein n=1 Tax=Marasmius tenuissimus TaxID=585030 RepID=A0ABR2ZKZ0_9AGAR